MNNRFEKGLNILLESVEHVKDLVRNVFIEERARGPAADVWEIKNK